MYDIMIVELLRQMYSGW